jgi:uncharacterized protein
VTGAWDATLLSVMGGAIAVYALAFALTSRRAAPLFGAAFASPARRDLDAPLLGGAALYGVGSGRVGLCPGPALASVARGEPEVFVFLSAVRAGMLVQQRLVARAPTEAGRVAVRPSE